MLVSPLFRKAPDESHPDMSRRTGPASCGRRRARAAFAAALHAAAHGPALWQDATMVAAAARRVILTDHDTTKGHRT